MRVQINGAEFVLPANCVVSEAMKIYQAQMPYAVMINQAFVPKSQHADHFLKDGDRIDVIGAIQGG
ncbi:sulfur carrier protein ThiS [Thiomicrorhabdus sp.]|uniref:sulfur carrier protein ThiS n=1 Tax=Thiomicrorhabdus sp. TaxID=2039724 RepID=UPI0029C98560|nr:sulfur carrier protein ThiS [Thiomicrorhabdus sp.]